MNLKPPDELEAFFERHYRPLVASLFLYCGNRAIAEEAAQDAFSTACRDWHKVRDMASANGWLYRVAYNNVNGVFRRARTAAHAMSRQRHPNDGTHRDVDVAEQVTVRAAIRMLTPKRRQAVVLHYYAGMSVAEVSHAMDVAEGTVKSLLHRARGQLEELLQNDDPAREVTSDVH